MLRILFAIAALALTAAPSLADWPVHTPPVATQPIQKR